MLGAFKIMFYWSTVIAETCDYPVASGRKNRKKKNVRYWLLWQQVQRVSLNSVKVMNLASTGKEMDFLSHTVNPPQEMNTV